MKMIFDKLFRKLLGDETGVAAVEFAIILPFLLVLAIGGADLGLAFAEKMKVQSAVNTGMHHVIQTQGHEVETTKAVIVHGIENESALVQVIPQCRCQGTPTSCSSTCSSKLKRFVLGSGQLAYKTPIFNTEFALGTQFEVFVGDVSP